MKWAEVREQDPLLLYAGDIYREHEGWIGLSQKRDDARHVLHNCEWPMPLPDNSVATYQSEDVFEHIEKDRIPAILEEIYRVLKPGGLFRWSMPDYNCDILRARSVKNDKGRILFDPGGGGRFIGGRVVDGGHVWFPTYAVVDNLLLGSSFDYKKTTWLHYYETEASWITSSIDFTKGHIQRVPPHDERVTNPLRPMSLVVDVYK